MGTYLHIYRLVYGLFAFLVFCDVQGMTIREQDELSDTIERLVPSVVESCVDKICSHLEPAERSNCAEELVHLCDHTANTDQRKTSDSSAYVMKNANGKGILRYECPPSKPCDSDVKDRVTMECLDILSLCNSNRLPSQVGITSKLLHELKRVNSMMNAQGDQQGHSEDRETYDENDGDEPCGELCEDQFQDMNSKEIDKDDPINSGDINFEPYLENRPKANSDERTGSDDSGITKKWSERLNPFSKKWSARVSLFSKKWSERLTPFSKKWGNRLLPYNKRMGGNPMQSEKRWNSRPTPFSKKSMGDISLNYEKKWSARLTPFTKKDTEGIVDISPNPSQPLQQGLDKKWSERLTPFTKKWSERLTPFAKKWSERLTPFAKKWSERVPPNFIKKWSERLTPFSKKWNGRLTPNFGKKWSERLTPFAKKWSERLPPSFNKKWSERLTPFSKKSLAFPEDQSEEKFSNDAEVPNKSRRVKRWSERLLPHMMSHSRRAIAMRAIVENKNKIKRVLLRRSLHPHLTSQPEWELLRRYPWNI